MRRNLTTHNVEEGDQSLGAVGKCIYCGAKSSDLTTEHIIPYGLSGTLTLEQASCPQCSGITSSFEEKVLRRHLLGVRAGLKLKTRRPKERPSTFPIQLGDAKSANEFPLTIEQQPILLVLPHFPEPHFIVDPYGQTYTPGITVVGAGFAQVAGPPLAEFKKWLTENGYSTSEQEVITFPVAFAKMLAKIAYASAVADFGLEGLSAAFVLPAILGETEDIGMWVGSIDDYVLESTGLHRVNLEVRDDLIYARIKLFAAFGTPTYLVVVGRATQALLEKINAG